MKAADATHTSTSTKAPAKDTGQPFFQKDMGGGEPFFAIQRQPQAKTPEFSVNNFVHNFGFFNSQYAVVGPEPATGTLFISHHVFFDFPRSVTKPEQTTFETDFVKSIHDGWSNKHLLTLNEPGFSKYRANVDVTAVPEAKAGDAHTVIHVVKPGAKEKRFRSRVTGQAAPAGSITTHQARMDLRDPTVAEDTKLNEPDFLQDVGNFDFDKADLNTDCQAAIKKIKDFIATIPPAKDPNDCTFSLQFTGRASAEGSVAYNKALSQRRMDSVSKELDGLPGLCLTIGLAAGKEEATTDASFRHVSVGVFRQDSTRPKTDQQNVAAHEFGHMIGLGDEYVDTRPDVPGARAKFFGDKPTHYDPVKDLIGQDAADELKITDSSNIMSRGNTVKRGHYVMFVAAIDAMTRPEIQAATGKPDAKWDVK
ncbi:hypothetical protein ACQ86N_04105 [Puia sp. P3]|uniref:hypothetical protein n=1 Tax=Puia sp. P3 TaxID=3423952 RepID=UPI003D66A30A